MMRVPRCSLLFGGMASFLFGLNDTPPDPSISEEVLSRFIVFILIVLGVLQGGPKKMGPLTLKPPNFLNISPISIRFYNLIGMSFGFVYLLFLFNCGCNNSHKRGVTNIGSQF